MFNFRLINQVRIQTTCVPPVTRIQDDMSTHKFNRAMVNVSIRLALDLVADKLIGNMRVSMTNKVYKTIKNDRHHSVTTELLERKWGILLGRHKRR